MRSWFDRLAERGDEVLSQLVEEVVASPAFLHALETFLQTKGLLERRIQAVLKSMSVATGEDLEVISDRLDRLDRAVRRLERQQGAESRS